MAEQAMPRLRQRYQEEIVPALMAKFKYTNVNQVPKLEKIVLNMGLGDVKDNAKGLEAAVQRYDDDRRPAARCDQGYVNPLQTSAFVKA